jgi:hypothetical protein
VYDAQPLPHLLEILNRAAKILTHC